MVTEIDGKRVFISVPVQPGGPTGVSFKALGNEVIAIGPNDKSLGIYMLTRNGSGGSIEFTGADGHISNTVFSVSKTAGGEVTISGSNNGSAFSSVYSLAGKRISGKTATGVNLVESNIASALLHIELPPKPSPTIPVTKDPGPVASHQRARTGIATGPVADPNNVHCALAIVATVLAAAAVETGVAAFALSVAIHTAAFECFF